jgi:hypothetical protein
MRNEPTIEPNAVTSCKEDVFEFEANLPRRTCKRRARMKNHAVFDSAGIEKSKQSHKAECSPKVRPKG